MIEKNPPPAELYLSEDALIGLENYTASFRSDVAQLGAFLQQADLQNEFLRDELLSQHRLWSYNASGFSHVCTHLRAGGEAVLSPIWDPGYERVAGFQISAEDQSTRVLTGRGVHAVLAAIFNHPDDRDILYADLTRARQALWDRRPLLLRLAPQEELPRLSYSGDYTRDPAEELLAELGLPADAGPELWDALSKRIPLDFWGRLIMPAQGS